MSATTNLEHTKDEDEEQEFEFRLFRSQPAQVEARTKSPGKDQAEHDNGNGVRKLKIRVRSPTPTPQGSGEGRFLNPFRGWEYYFTDPEMVIQTVGGNNSHQQSKQKSNEEQQRLLAKEKFGDVAITGDQILAGAALGPMVRLFIVYYQLKFSFPCIIEHVSLTSFSSPGWMPPSVACHTPATHTVETERPEEIPLDL